MQHPTGFSLFPVHGVPNANACESVDILVDSWGHDSWTHGKAGLLTCGFMDLVKFVNA